jgi:hypothetical protein
VLLIAAPAAASVITQTFGKGDVTAAAACFTRAEGADAIAYASNAQDPYADVNTTSTVTDSSSGVIFVQDTVTVTGYEGARVTYTDVVRFVNGCDHPISLTLTVENDPGGGADLSGTWSDKAVKLYLAKTATPGTDLTNGTNWEQQFIHVAKNDTPGAVTGASTGTVTIPAGSELQGAFVIEVDDDGAAGFTSTTGTFRYTAEAIAG